MTGDELALLLAEGAVVVVDVRTREEYLGQAGYPCDPRQGHIEGAMHVDWEDLYAAAGSPLGRRAIEDLLTDRGVDSAARIVTYCHSGQRSAMAAFALSQAGFTAENYEGSWHEWSRRDGA